jgi:capsular exopolysaccharide synthesis family protein
MKTQDNNYSYVPYQNVEIEDGVNIRAILFRYIRNWYWFAISIGLMCVAAFFYLRYKTPIYKSQASVLIKDEKKGLDQESALQELEIFAPKKVVENEIEILKSYTLMDRVVQQLNLTISYFHDTPYGKREIYDQSPIRLIVEKGTPILYEEPLAITFINGQTVSINGKQYPVNTSVDTPYGRLRVFTRKNINNKTEPLFIEATDRVEVVTNLLKNFTAAPTSKASTVITLGIETAVPDKGVAILDRLIMAYNEAAVTDKNIVASKTLQFIEDRLNLISGELSSVEKGVEEYKSSQGITDLGTQAETFLKAVQENDAQLNQVNVQLGALQDLEGYVNKQPGNRGGTPATLGLNDPTLLGLIENVTKLEAQRDELARTTSEMNPMLQTIDSQIKTAKSSIAENVSTMKKMLTTAKQQYVSTNNKMEGVMRTIPRKERVLMDITRQQSIKNNLYTYLLKKREETAVSFASTISDSRIIDEARTDKDPVKPKKQMIFLLFALGGLLIPISVMAGRDMLNNRIVRRTEVEEQTNVPILGEVVKKRQAESLVVGNQSQSIIAEQIRTLRTNLQFLRESRDGSQVLLFTSSISGEGKSFVSLNLGASLALVGKRTVILEMDLRKPRLRSSLNDMANGMGLSNYLSGEVELDEVVKPIPERDDYFIITSGPIPPNPAELLSGPRLEKLILELRDQFDYVIIDAPPIGLVTDAQIIAPFSDATMFIVRHDVTPKNSIKMVETLYQEKRFNKLNIILNGVGDGEDQYYSYGYNSKGYYN